MEIFKSLIVTIVGFLVGLALAGAGGLSAEAYFSSFKSSENLKKIETYWRQSNISYSEVEALISNIKCNSSDHYKVACLNSLLQIAEEFKYDLYLTNGKIQDLPSRFFETYLTEKLSLSYAKNHKWNIDFDKSIKSAFEKTSTELQAELAGSYINGFLSIYYDPHTYVLPSAYYNEVGSKSERSELFVGLSYSRKNENFYIDKISINSDADHAGLKKHDKIISINNINVKNKEIKQISEILKNSNTSKFSFVIERNNVVQNIEFSRSYRLLSHAQFNLLNNYSEDTLITLSKFNRGICADIKKYLNSHNNLQNIVLDLRDNPGGQLDEVACLAGLFLGPDKKAYYVEYLNPNLANEVILTTEDLAYSGPLVVLTNSRSASAAESLAGALQEHQRALIVGRRTFGKGTFQEPEEWTQNVNLSLFKTQGYYLLPSRNSTQIAGVRPDIELAQADNFEKREADVFYKPLKANEKIYPKLKESELVKINFSAVCLNKTDQKQSDALNVALQILDCENQNKLKMADAGQPQTNF